MTIFKLKKSYLALILSLFAASGIFALHKGIISLMSEPIFTTIGIFADYGHPEADDGRAIIYEALKTIDGNCEHVFVNKKLFKEFYQFLLPELFSETWTAYDTKIGLLYLRHKNASEVGLKIDQFILIEDPFDETVLAQIQDGNWAETFHTILDSAVWNKKHAHPKSRAMIYTNGHGTADSKNSALEMLVSTSASRYVQLLKFFDELKIDLVGIQSCHWTADRIQRLIKNELNTDNISFTLLTPATIERPIWIDTHINYLQNESPSFFDVCCDAAYSLNNALTKEIAETIKSTDTLQLPGNVGQQASLIFAHTKNIQVV